VSNEQLLTAIADAARDHPVRLPIEWYFPSSLRAAPSGLRADRPPEPPEPPTAEIVPAEPYEAPVAAATAADLVPVWLLRADISVWRTRWFWRLVAAFVVRRLGRSRALLSMACPTLYAIYPRLLAGQPDKRKSVTT
jgi:hypothetical protein